MNPAQDFVTITASLDHSDFAKSWFELVNHPIFAECHPQFSEKRRLARIQNAIGDVLLNGCRQMRTMIHEMTQRPILVRIFLHV